MAGLQVIYKGITSDRHTFTISFTHLNSGQKLIMPVNDFKVSHNSGWHYLKRKRSTQNLGPFYVNLIVTLFSIAWGPDAI